METHPEYLGAGAVYPDSLHLRKKYSFIDRFDEPYVMYREATYKGDQVLVLPRNCSPVLGGPFDKRGEGEDVFFQNNFVPRNKEQEKVVAKVNALLDDDVSHICQAMTGFGKTYVGCAAAAHQQKRTLIITTKEDIIKQWANAAKAVLGLDDEDIGYIQGDNNTSEGKPFVIALVHSALKGPDRYDEATFAGFGLVITDEVHRMGAEQFCKAMWWLDAKLRLGLSATPYRKDGRDVIFRAHIGEVLVKGKQETMVPAVVVAETGWKVPMVPRGNKMVPLPHQHGRLMGVCKAMASDHGRNMKLCRFIKAAHAKGRNIIIFSDIVEHLEALRAICIQTGVPHKDTGMYVGLQYYKGKKHEKEAQREKTKTKPLIFATYKMASEATDVPWADTCVLGTPRADVNQIVGRIRREWEGKPQPVVFDPQDSSSKVLRDYAGARLKWYRSIGATVKYVK